MFSASMSNGKLLRDSIDTISQIIDEVTIKLTPDGLEILSADRAMVTVVNFHLSSKAFDEYTCDTEMTIGMNLVNLLTLLKRAGDDKVSLKLNDEKNRLELFFSGDSVRAFTLPVLDVSKEDVPDISKFDFPAKAQIMSTIVSRGVDDADAIADSVGLELGSKGFRMFAEGTSSKSELKLSNSSAGIMNIQATDSVKSKYPLDYMKKIMKASKLSDKSWVSLGNDYPLKVDFQGENVTLSFIVAPRVSEE